MSQSSSVCDQGTTNRVAIKALTQEYTDDKPSPYHFVLNGTQQALSFSIQVFHLKSYVDFGV